MESLFDISTAFGYVETSLANKKHNKPSNRNLTFITLFYYNGNMWGTGQTSINQPQPAKGRPLHGMIQFMMRFSNGLMNCSNQPGCWICGVLQLQRSLQMAGAPGACPCRASRSNSTILVAYLLGHVLVPLHRKRFI